MLVTGLKNLVMNEPRLSINDIINNKFKEGTFINRLKELVQKR